MGPWAWLQASLLGKLAQLGQLDPQVFVERLVVRLSNSLQRRNIAGYLRICTAPSKQPRSPPVGRRWTFSELESMRQEDERAAESPRCFWLPEHLSGTEDLDTWPESLRDFPWQLPRTNRTFPEYNSPKSITKVCKALREHYPEDEILMRFADFIESEGQSAPSVLFSLNYISTCETNHDPQP